MYEEFKFSYLATARLPGNDLHDAEHDVISELPPSPRVTVSTADVSVECAGDEHAAPRIWEAMVRMYVEINRDDLSDDPEDQEHRADDARDTAFEILHDALNATQHWDPPRSIADLTLEDQ